MKFVEEEESATAMKPDQENADQETRRLMLANYSSTLAIPAGKHAIPCPESEGSLLDQVADDVDHRLLNISDEDWGSLQQRLRLLCL